MPLLDGIRNNILDDYDELSPEKKYKVQEKTNRGIIYVVCGYQILLTIALMSYQHNIQKILFFNQLLAIVCAFFMIRMYKKNKKRKKQKKYSTRYDKNIKIKKI